MKRLFILGYIVLQVSIVYTSFGSCLPCFAVAETDDAESSSAFDYEDLVVRMVPTRDNRFASLVAMFRSQADKCAVVMCKDASCKNIAVAFQERSSSGCQDGVIPVGKTASFAFVPRDERISLLVEGVPVVEEQPLKNCRVIFVWVGGKKYIVEKYFK